MVNKNPKSAATPVTSFRLPRETRAQLDALIRLARAGGASASHARTLVLCAAIDAAARTAGVRLPPGRPANRGRRPAALE